MLIENPKGNYSFLKGIAPYSGGAVASRRFEVEHARLQAALPLHAGFAAVDKHLKAVGQLESARTQTKAAERGLLLILVVALLIEFNARARLWAPLIPVTLPTYSFSKLWMSCGWKLLCGPRI